MRTNEYMITHCKKSPHDATFNVEGLVHLNNGEYLGSILEELEDKNLDNLDYMDG